MVRKKWVVHNLLISLIIFNRFLTNMPYNCIIFSKLSLIASPSCGRFIQPKQTTTTTWRLACLSYTKSLPNSKTNLLYPEKALNGAPGSYTRSWLSWCPLLPRKRLTFFDALTRSLETLISTKSAFTLSWLHPKFHGNDCGRGGGCQGRCHLNHH